MKETIKKINELVYPKAKALIAYEPNEVTLEMLLVALSNVKDYHYIETDLFIDNIFRVVVQTPLESYNEFMWQLNKTLTEQSESTKQTIKNLFE